MKETREKVGTSISLESLVWFCVQNDSSIEDIAHIILPMEESTRECFMIVARALHKQELAKKIEQAIDIFLLTRIKQFRKAVKEGTYKEFLRSFTWAQIVSLLNSIECFSQKYPEEEKRNEEDIQFYSSLLRTILIEKAREETMCVQD